MNQRPPGYEPDELPTALLRDMVPETGVEPARDFSHGILSPGRLPIPPLRHPSLLCVLHIWCLYNLTQYKPSVKLFSKLFSRVIPTHTSPALAYTNLYLSKKEADSMRIEQEPRPLLPEDRSPQDVDDLVFLWETQTLTPSDR